MDRFKLVSKYKPTGDQPQAIEQLVEGIRPDVLAINRFLISGDDMLALIKSQAGQRPIYINNPPLELIQTMDVTQVGSLYRLEPRR